MDFQTSLKVFDFDGRRVRIVEKDGQPWWVAKDVCEVLGIINSRDALSALDDDEKSHVGKTDISPEYADMLNIPNRGINVVNESGLYTLITRSNKPESRKFRKWVTSEVLPSIRRYGGYLGNRKIEEVLTDLDTIIRLALNIKAVREECHALEAKIDADSPESRLRRVGPGERFFNSRGRPDETYKAERLPDEGRREPEHADSKNDGSRAVQSEGAGDR
jgi:anti-repressor protein